MASTMIELVQELEKIEPRTPQIEFMIAEAKAGEYHDYKNQKYYCGKIMLVEHLKNAGLKELSQRVIAGEFDEEADEDDKENMRKDILANSKTPDEAQKMMRILGL